MDATGRPSEQTAHRSARLAAEIGVASETGARPRNEDYAGVFSDKAASIVVAAVADGVGGAKGGRVAAELAVRGFVDACASIPADASVKARAHAALLAVNRWVHALGRTDDNLAGMACAFTALVLRGRGAHVFHVGDTRLYRLRGDRLEQVTADHVAGPVGMSVLARAIGAEDGLKVDYVELDLDRHDRFLLCTDGVHGGVREAAIAEGLARRASPEETAQSLVDRALASRVGDNATALVLDVTEAPEASLAALSAGLPAKIAPPPAPGEVVDGFRLDALLGDSRYVTVFRATDEMKDGRQVVLKFPKPLEGADGPMREAFLRETWVASLVRSPHVGEILNVPPERRTRLYLALPFYEGETLEARLLRRPPLSAAAGLEIAKKLASGVAALHRAGIVHRDIKPDNVILEKTAPGQGASLKLVDFGVARLRRSKDIALASEPGTPSYMAPELFDGAAADEITDQYALGVTIFRMFSGRYPYGEIEPFSRPRFRTPALMSATRPDLPAWLDGVLGRAIAVDREERYGDVLELMFELEHGADRASPVLPRRRSLYERNPTLVWRCVSLCLAIALLIALFRLHLR